MGARIYTNIAILLCHAGQESSDHSYPDVAEVRPGSVRFNNAIREQASSLSEEVLSAYYCGPVMVLRIFLKKCT